MTLVRVAWRSGKAKAMGLRRFAKACVLPLGFIFSSIIGYGIIGAGCSSSSKPPAPSKLLNPRAPETEPVALIDGQPLAPARLNVIFAARVSADRGAQQSTSMAAGLKIAIARELVDAALVERAAARREVRISDADVNAALRDLAASFPNQAAYRHYVETYSEQAAGLANATRLRLTTERLAGIDAKGNAISDAQVREYYDQHANLFQVPAHLEALDIFFATPTAAKPDDIARINEKAKRVLALACDRRHSFAALATRFSEGPTAPSGGSMGRVTESTVDPVLWKALAALNPGQVSDIIKTPQGLHIVTLRAKVAATNTALAAARPGIERTLRAQHRSARIADLMAALRKEARIDNVVERRYLPLLTPVTIPEANTLGANTALGVRTSALPGSSPRAGATATTPTTGTPAAGAIPSVPASKAEAVNSGANSLGGVGISGTLPEAIPMSSAPASGSLQ